jgi:hypothetical protein
MGSDQISGHVLIGDSKTITKICSDPTLRSPRRLQNQVGWHAAGEELVLQKSRKHARASTSYFMAHAARALLQIFHPKPVHHPLDWPHGAQRVENLTTVAFYLKNWPLTKQNIA